MGEAIQKMTSGLKVLGLTDRGVLAEGLKADINVFDADEVTELQPTLVTISRAAHLDSFNVRAVLKQPSSMAKSVLGWRVDGQSRRSGTTPLGLIIARASRS